MWIAVASNTLYDFKDQSEKLDYSVVPAEKNQKFVAVHFTTNMRNGSHIIDLSFKLQDKVIEKGTKSLQLENKNDRVEDNDKWWKSFTQDMVKKIERKVWWFEKCF